MALMRRFRFAIPSTSGTTRRVATFQRPARACENLHANVDHLSSAMSLLEAALLASAPINSRPRASYIVRGQGPSPNIIKQSSAKNGGLAWPETICTSTAHGEEKRQPPPSGLDLGGLRVGSGVCAHLWGTGLFDRPTSGAGLVSSHCVSQFVS